MVDDRDAIGRELHIHLHILRPQIGRRHKREYLPVAVRSADKTGGGGLGGRRGRRRGPRWGERGLGERPECCERDEEAKDLSGIHHK